MGKCETCKFRSVDGYCMSDKLEEDVGRNEWKKHDMLIYSHSEGGVFWVGPNFGCVHHTDA